MADEGQSPNVLRSVEASSTVCSARRGYEPDPFVIADRLDIDPCASGQSSDCDHWDLLL